VVQLAIQNATNATKDSKRRFFVLSKMFRMYLWRKFKTFNKEII